MMFASLCQDEVVVYTVDENYTHGQPSTFLTDTNIDEEDQDAPPSTLLSAVSADDLNCNP